ncbi:MAG: YIP1 family protein [Cyclobacteriaceae bacterium]
MKEFKLLLINPRKLIAGVAEETIANNTLIIILFFTLISVYIQSGSFDYSSIMAVLKIAAIFIITIIMVLVLIVLRSQILNWAASLFKKSDEVKNIRFAISYSMFPLVFALIIWSWASSSILWLAILIVLLLWSYLILTLMLSELKKINHLHAIFSILIADAILALPIILISLIFQS